MGVSEVADLYILLRAVADPKGFAEFQAKGEAAAGGIAGSMKKILPVSAAVTGAVLLGAGMSVKWATDFQTAYTKLYTAAGASKDQVLANTDAMLKLGNQTGFTGTQIAEAMYHPISAGLDMAHSLEVVKFSAMEAQISGAKLDDTTYSLSSVMKAFNMPVQDTGKSMAMLNAIVGDGDMRFQDFNVSIKNWAPTAAQMGISIQSMGAGLAYLTDRGNSAEEAATRMTMGISLMATPSAQAAKLLVGLGVASTDVKAGTAAMTEVLKKAHITQNDLAKDLAKPDGLYVALHHLKDALKAAGVSGTEADSVLSKIFGGGRSDKAIMSLMQNLDGLKQKYDQIGKDASPEAFAQHWADAQNTMKVQFDKVKAAVVDLGIKIGEKLIPYVAKLLDWFLKGTDWLSKHRVVMAALAGVIMALMVPAIVAATVAFGSFLIAAAPFIAVGAAIGAVAYEIYTHWDTVWGFLKKVWKWFQDQSPLVKAAIILITGPLGMLAAAAYEVYTHWQQVVDFLKGAWDWIKQAATDTADWVSHAWDATVQWVKNAWDTIVRTLKETWDKITQTWDSTGGKAVTYISHAWDKTSAAVSGEWRKIVDNLRQIWSLLVQLWDATGGQIVHFATVAWDFVWNHVIKPIWDLITIYLKGGMDLLVIVLKTGWDIVSGIFRIAWDLIKGIVQVAWDVIKGFVQLGIDIIKTTIKVGWDVVKGIVQVAWDLIKGIINTALDFIKNLLQLFVDFFTGRWSRLWSDLKALAAGLWNDIWNTISSWLGIIKNTVVNVAGDIWRGFTSAISNATSNIWNAMVDIWNTITGFFKDAGKWLWNAGKALIQGLVDGVKSMFNTVKDTLGSLTNALTSWKGPPEKDAMLLHGSGQLIMKGLIAGIVSQRDALRRELGGVTEMIGGTSPGFGAMSLGSRAVGSTGIGSGSAFGAGARSGQPIVVVNVNGSVLSERNLRDVVQTQFLQLGARNSQTYAPYKR